ncbi:MAG TPA: hypothetical protein VJK72_04350 [Candidatus Nanoarchaeia archaeon]|nr:hypothetical protein [Candidatus Nanoarchaeia archaeon]
MAPRREQKAIRPLILITEEAQREFARQGFIEQVSPPLLFGLRNGTPPDKVHEGIECVAAEAQYMDANAYMRGGLYPVNEVNLIPFVLYRINTPEKPQRTK